MSDFPADFFSSPSLSLSLAGIFRGGGSRRREETVDVSSGKSRSGDESCHELLGESGGDELLEEDNGTDKLRKKRKKYHRHSPQQIREMEALFKVSPHPDEKQRLELSKRLGLHPRQVKFWFQNRRTQIKAIQERHESSLLKSEIDKLRDENKALRVDPVKKATSSCSNCGHAATGIEDQKLRIENARLRAEVEKLRSIVEKHPLGTSPNTSSHPSSWNDQEDMRSTFDFYTGSFNPDEKSRTMDAANRAVDELKRMATGGEPLWIRSYETGREILNYDEYLKEFCDEKDRDIMPTDKLSIEASRESGIIFVDMPWLVKSFMDADQWKELFPCLVATAVTVDIICNGEGANRDGAVHLMFAEIQMLTPMVATREVYFVRHCKQINANQWAIVDVSVDKAEDNIDSSLQKSRKRPSGCIIEDKSNGHCKVIWVEHSECQKTSIHSLYRAVVISGLAFGAKHWISTLQQQCERLVFLVATNVPLKDSSGVATLAGRKSILKLAQRMTWNFCKALGDSCCNSWSKITTKTGGDIRVALRENLNDPGEPLGTILSAVSSVWLPVGHHALFDFLRDESRRNEWDIVSKGRTIQSIANLAKGRDRGNAVTALAMKTDGDEHNTWVLQDSSTNPYESMVVYAPVDINGMQSVMTGCDSSNIRVLPSGFSILPDGIESRPFLITSRTAKEESAEGGSLLTIAFQALVNNPPTEKPSSESVNDVNTLISCTLQSIKRSLQCED